MNIVIACLSVLAAAPPPSSPSVSSPASDRSIFILGLRSNGVPAELAAAMTEKLAERVAALSDWRVVTVHELADSVKQQKALESLGCSDNGCAAEITRLAKTRHVLSGTVGKIGKDYVVSISLVDAQSGASGQKADGRFDNLAAADAQLTALVQQVLGLQGAPPQKARYKLPGDRQTSFAVFDLRALGVEADVASNLTQMLAAEVKRVQGTRVVSRDDIASMLALEKQKDALGCTDSVTCLAEIGGALGVDKLIVGSVGKVESSFVISLRLIDARRVIVESRVSESFQGLTEQLVPAVRHAGRSLLGLGQAEKGGLTLSTSALDAEVILNDKAIGVSPLPPVKDLPPGRHSLRLKKSGFADWRSDIYIEPGDMTALWAPLVKLPPPWYKTWWFWTITGVVVAGAGVLTAVLLAGGNNGTLQIEYQKAGR